jgi:hypothetical protein
MPHQQVRGPIRTALVGFGVAGSVFHAPLIALTPTIVSTSSSLAMPNA